MPCHAYGVLELFDQNLNMSLFSFHGFVEESIIIMYNIIKCYSLSFKYGFGLEYENFFVYGMALTLIVIRNHFLFEGCMNAKFVEYTLYHIFKF